MNDFSSRLKELRNKKGILQRELADHLNVSRVTVTQYETGNRSPDDDIKISIAKYFNVSLDYLMGNSDIKNPYNQSMGRLNIPNKDNTDLVLPTEFETPEEAMKFVLEQNVIMGFGGFDVDKLSDDEVVEFANSLLEHLKLLSLKYKKK